MHFKMHHDIKWKRTYQFRFLKMTWDLHLPPTSSFCLEEQFTVITFRSFSLGNFLTIVK